MMRGFGVIGTATEGRVDEPQRPRRADAIPVTAGSAEARPATTSGFGIVGVAMEGVVDEPQWPGRAAAISVIVAGSRAGPAMPRRCGGN